MGHLSNEGLNQKRKVLILILGGHTINPPTGQTLNGEHVHLQLFYAARYYQETAALFRTYCATTFKLNSVKYA